MNEPIHVAIVFNAFVVALLTWVVMPLITRALHGWLNPQYDRTIT